MEGSDEDVGGSGGDRLFEGRGRKGRSARGRLVQLQVQVRGGSWQGSLSRV